MAALNWVTIHPTKRGSTAILAQESITSEVTCSHSILPNPQHIITMAHMKTRAEKNDTSEALPLLEYPNHKSKPIAISAIAKHQRREAVYNISNMSIQKCEDHTVG